MPQGTILGRTATAISLQVPYDATVDTYIVYSSSVGPNVDWAMALVLENIPNPGDSGGYAIFPDFTDEDLGVVDAQRDHYIRIGTTRDGVNSTAYSEPGTKIPSTDAPAAPSGAGLESWTEDEAGNLLPNEVAAQSLGSVEKTILNLILQGVIEVYRTNEVAVRIGVNGIDFGPGTDEPTDYQISYGRDANGAPFVSFGGIYILRGDASPVGLATGGAGTTLYLRSDGTLWSKTGSGPSNWTQFALPSPPSTVRVRQNSNQTFVGDGSYVDLNLATVVINRGGMSTGNAAAPVQIQEAGEYDINALVAFDVTAAPGQVGIVVMVKRGGVDVSVAASVSVSMASGDAPTLTVSNLSVPLLQGDILRVQVSQWTGQDLTTAFDALGAPILTVRKVP